MSFYFFIVYESSYLLYTRDITLMYIEYLLQWAGIMLSNSIKVSFISRELFQHRKQVLEATYYYKD